MNSFGKLDRKDIRDILALTPMQEGMLFHYLENPQSDLFFEQLSLGISGEINNEFFEKAWNFVIETNEMLRAVFRWEKVERPVQLILKEHKLQWRYDDFTGKSSGGGGAKKRLEEIKAGDRKIKFNLREVPFRVTLCKVREADYEMIISNHHILYDGWSNGIILKEFFNAYHDFANGREPGKTLKTGFKEFVKWMQSPGADSDKQEKYWRDYLKPADTETKGATRQRRRAKDIPGTGNFRFGLAADMKGKLDHFTRARKITLAAVLYTAWGLLLQEYNNRNDILFATTVSGRPAKIRGIEDIVGLFINTLPLRIQTHTGEKIADLLHRTNDALQTREEYENTSAAIINEYLEKAGKNLLFDSVAAIENYPLENSLKQNKGPLIVRSYAIEETTRYDLTVIISVFQRIDIGITYNKGLFNRESIETLSRHFIAVIHMILNNPGNRVGEFAVLTAEEKDRIRKDLEGKQKPPLASRGAEVAYAAPRDGVEEKLAEIWAGVLNIQDGLSIGIDDHFFDFGGHSLKAGLLKAKIHKAFQAKIPLAEIFKRPTIRSLAGYLKEETGKGGYLPIEPTEKKEYYPLSSAQRRFYMLQRMALESTVYNGPLVMMVEGKLHKEKFAEAFKRLVCRHESLRTSFQLIDGRPVQRIHDEVEFGIEFFDLTAKTREGPRRAADFIYAFDLSTAPLLRVVLQEINETRHLLIIDMHHIISDGTSRGLLIKEFAALVAGKELPPVKLHNKDFSVWQNFRLKNGKLKAQEDYWLKQFSGAGSGEVPVLNMPLDFPRPSIRDVKGDNIRFRVREELSGKIHRLLEETGATLFMVLLAVYNILLARYSGREDIVTGTTTAGRNHADLENITGLLLETLALRNWPGGDKTFEGFLKEVKESTINAYEHQDYPFRELIKQVAADGDLSRNPLFDAMLIVQNVDNAGLAVEGLRFIPYGYYPGTAKVDFTLEAEESAQGIDLTLEYGTALFKKETMERFSRHFLNILEAVTAHPTGRKVKLSAIQIVTEEEKRQILTEFNGTALEYADEALVHRLFEGRAEKNPDSTAVVSHGPGGGAMTYGLLNHKSHQLAYALKEKGVGPDTIVGIMAEPSLEMIGGLLGILKAGGAYLPIDPGYPQERIDFMLKDSDAKMVVNGQTHPVPSGRPSLGGSFSPRCGAYVIYTSGSTGRPKGVMVEHRNLTAYLNAFEREFEILPDDVIIQQASFSFDTFGEEVYPVLLQGGKIVVPRKSEVRDASVLVEIIFKHNVTIIDCSPLLLNELNKQDRAKLAGLRLCISGGDILKKEYIANLLKGAAVYNTYGPTEATICASYYCCRGQDPANVPIGRPITNYNIYILDRENNLLPVGIPGELCISGTGVSRGYLNNPELTAEKYCLRRAGGSFEKPPPAPPQNFLLRQKFFGGSRGAIFQKSPPGRRRPRGAGSLLKIYKTGDLARWLSDGNIDFLGRIDHQIKIRGYRIEPGEIERQLLKHRGISEAVVTVKENKHGDKHLNAYIVPGDSPSFTFSTTQLRDYLSNRLPRFMLPSYFFAVAAVPYTPGGKLDVKALPCDGGTLDTAAPYAPPADEVEAKLAAMWSRDLNKENIGIDDNFFELGGQSIIAMRMAAQVQELFHVNVPLLAFFQEGTIREIARIVKQEQAGKRSGKEPEQDHTFAGLKLEKVARVKEDLT